MNSWVALDLRTCFKQSDRAIETKRDKYIICVYITETLDDEYFERLAFDDEEEIPDDKIRKKQGHDLQDTEAEDILKSIGIYRDRKSPDVTEMAPMNRFWLHDTPGAINDAQVYTYIHNTP